MEEPANDKRKYSRCKQCKKAFAQAWDKKAGKYSKQESCAECAGKNKGESEVLTYKIDYVPYPYQAVMHESGARFRVVSGGIRSGKDYAMMFELVLYLFACANRERPSTMIPKVLGWIVGPSEKIAKQNFDQLRRLVPSALIASESRSAGEMILKNGVEIRIKSTYDPEELVGVALDAVLITEAARIRDRDAETVWTNLEGRLNSPGRGVDGKGGIGLINSSPRGRNYFYKMWTWGQKNHPNHDPDWESWTWTHFDNPEIAAIADVTQKNGRTYRENLELRTSKARFAQDYLAIFLLSEYAVFPKFDKCLEYIPANLKGDEREEYIREWRSPKTYNSYTIGYDPANIGDEPIVWVVENATGKVMNMYNLKGKDWDAQFDEIAYISRLYNNAPVSFGRTGHEIVGSQLIKRGLVTNPINEQGANKANLVENLVRIVERQLLTVLDDGSKITETVKAEFDNYVRSKIGGRTVFGNGPDCEHDDHVSAAYFAFSDTDTIAMPLGFDCSLYGVAKNKY
ncbi:MAG: hypothetical protein GX811_06940 [Lentisphaerae bacterium]|nr:hypothetical protein [Lentisphaerota bacterium]